MTDRDAVLFGAVFIALSLLLAAGGVVCLVRDARRRRRWVAAEGRVVETLEHDEGGNKSYQPSVEYRAQGSATPHRVSGNSWYSKPRWQLGDARTVHYDPASPGEGILDRSTGLRFTGGTLLFAGVTLTLVGLLFVAAGVSPPDSPIVRFLRATNSSE